MHHFLRHEGKSIAALLVFFLIPACTQYHIVRVTVPVEEASTIGKLTHPVKRPAAVRTLLGASDNFVRVGEITRVRLIGPLGDPLKTIPLPFYADEQKGHLVIQDNSGKLNAIPLTRIDRIEVESLLPAGSWKVTDYLLLLGFTVLVGLSFVAVLFMHGGRQDPDFN